MSGDGAVIYPPPGVGKTCSGRTGCSGPQISSQVNVGLLTTCDWGGLTCITKHQLETRCLRAASPRKQQVVIIIIIACVMSCQAAYSCLTLITRRGNVGV